MSCQFCQIARGEVKAMRVYEDDLVVAFMDRAPVRPGHLQIIPRQHHPYFDDLPEDVAARVIATGQRLARALKQLTGVARVAFVFSGGDIAHAHAHVVPMHDKTDITSRQYIAERELTFRGTPLASRDALSRMARALQDHLHEENRRR